METLQSIIVTQASIEALHKSKYCTLPGGRAPSWKETRVKCGEGQSKTNFPLQVLWFCSAYTSAHSTGWPLDDNSRQISQISHQPSTPAKRWTTRLALLFVVVGACL